MRGEKSDERKEKERRGMTGTTPSWVRPQKSFVARYNPHIAHFAVTFGMHLYTALLYTHVKFQPLSYRMREGKRRDEEVTSPAPPAHVPFHTLTPIAYDAITK
jgi:hypothetical protein